jgi:tetratricopeptide (TPR) repeat protein
MVADYTLLRRLDDARLLRLNQRMEATTIDSRPSCEGFASAFRDEYGVDVLGGEEAAVLTELGRRAIRADLVAALDDWSCQTKDPAESFRLLKLADALDPDPQGLAARWRWQELPRNVEERRRLAVEAERDPPSTAFLVRLGLGLIECSDREAGLRLLRLAWRRRPDDVSVLGVLAQQFLNAGPDHAAEALPYWTAALAIRPGSPIVLTNLAHTLIDLGRYEEALDHCHTALEIAPNAAVPHRNAGIALANLGRLEEAVVEFRRAVALAPDDGAAWHCLGTALRNNARRDQKRLEEVVEVCRKAVNLRKDAATYLVLSDVLHQLDRFADAEAAGGEAVRLAPRNAEAHCRLGLAQLDQRRPADAAESFRRAHELTPHFNYAYHWGLALTQLGKGLEAEEAYREAIRLKPDYAQAHCNLGQTLRRRGRFAEALDELRRGHKLGSQTPDWRYPSDRWVRECERLVELERQLPSILNCLP